MKPRTTRTLLRIVHIALGACLAVVVYAPAAWTEPLRLALGTVAVPAAILTGAAMWLQGPILRLVSRRRRHDITTGSAS